MKDLTTSWLVKHALKQWLETGELDRNLVPIYTPFHGKLTLTGVDGMGYTITIDSPISLASDDDRRCCH